MLNKSNPNLSEVFTNSAIQKLGECLNNALQRYEQDNIKISADYASLTDLENAETEEDFLEAIAKFLRRYHSRVKKLEEAGEENIPQISSEELKKVIELIEKNEKERGQRKGLKIIKAALISYALVSWKK